MDASKDSQKIGEASKRSAQPVETDAELEVKRFLNNFAKSIRAGELDEIMSFYSNEVVAFDMMPPLRFDGKQKYRQVAWKECFIDAFNFPVTYEWVDQKVIVFGDFAVVHGLLHMSGTFKKEGTKVENWLRSTVGLRRTKSDGWLSVHEHNSVPIGENGEALMDLKPYDSAH